MHLISWVSLLTFLQYKHSYSFCHQLRHCIIITDELNEL